MKSVHADDENRPDLQKSPLPQPPTDWEQVILDADARVAAVGELMLSDASCNRKLKEAAKHYDRAHFCSIIQQILLAGIQKLEDDAIQEEVEDNPIYQCLELNHEALSEWLVGRLGSARESFSSKGE